MASYWQPIIPINNTIFNHVYICVGYAITIRALLTWKSKKIGASWELNPGPLACLWLFTRMLSMFAQSENHTTRPHALRTCCRKGKCRQCSQVGVIPYGFITWVYAILLIHCRYCSIPECYWKVYQTLNNVFKNLSVYLEKIALFHDIC